MEVQHARRRTRQNFNLVVWLAVPTSATLASMGNGMIGLNGALALPVAKEASSTVTALWLSFPTIAANSSKMGWETGSTSLATPMSHAEIQIVNCTNGTIGVVATANAMV